jgi:hypothetical protein
VRADLRLEPTGRTSLGSFQPRTARKTTEENIFGAPIPGRAVGHLGLADAEAGLRPSEPCYQSRH